MSSATVASTQKLLADELAKDPTWGKLPIETEARDGALETKVVRAVAKGAYPGAGVLAVVLDEKTGTTYGRHGGRNLAVLVRARGFLEKPPAAADLLKLVDVAYFEQLAMVDESKRPVTVAKSPSGALVLSFVRRFFPSGASEVVTVTFPPEGDAKLESSPLE